MNYLLDTCVLSELVKHVPDPAVVQWVDDRNEHALYISSITLAELRRGVERLPNSRRRVELSGWLAGLEAGFDDRVLAFGSDTARTWATMMAAAEAQGRPLAAFDSMIAATALNRQMTLVTRNARDFVASGVSVLNPWTPE